MAKLPESALVELEPETPGTKRNRIPESALVDLEEPGGITGLTQHIAGLPEEIAPLETLKKLPGILKYPPLAGRGLADLLFGMPEFVRGLVEQEAKPGVLGIPFAPSLEKGKVYRRMIGEIAKGAVRTIEHPIKTLEEEPATFAQTALLPLGIKPAVRALRPQPKFVPLPLAEVPKITVAAGEGFTAQVPELARKGEIISARQGRIPPSAVEFRPQTPVEAEKIKAPEDPLAVNQKVLGKQPELVQEVLPLERAEPKSRIHPFVDLIEKGKFEEIGKEISSQKNRYDMLDKAYAARQILRQKMFFKTIQEKSPYLKAHQAVQDLINKLEGFTGETLPPSVKRFNEIIEKQIREIPVAETVDQFEKIEPIPKKSMTIPSKIEFEPGDIFEGPAYRAETARLGKGRELAREQIAFEKMELGNREIVEQFKSFRKRTGFDLRGLTGNDIVWVTKTAKKARQYGTPEKIELPKNSQVVATDGEGGYLVVKGSAIPEQAQKAGRVAPGHIGITPKDQFEFIGLKESLKVTDPPTVLFKNRRTGKTLTSESIKFDQVANPNQLTAALAEVRGKAKGVPEDFNFTEWDLDKQLSKLTGTLTFDEMSKRAAGTLGEPLTPKPPSPKPVALLPAPEDQPQIFRQPLFKKVFSFSPLEPEALMKQAGLWPVKAIRDLVEAPRLWRLDVQKQIDKIRDIQKVYREIKNLKSSRKVNRWLNLMIPDSQMTEGELKVGRQMRRDYEWARMNYINPWRKAKGLEEIATSEGYVTKLQEDLVRAYTQDQHPIPNELFALLKEPLPLEKFFGRELPRSRIPTLIEDAYASYDVYFKGLYRKIHADRVLGPLKEFVEKYKGDIPEPTQKYLKELVRREIMGKPNVIDQYIDSKVDRWLNPALARLGTVRQELPPDLAKVLGTNTWEMPRWQIDPFAATRLVGAYRSLNYMSLIGANLKTFAINLTQPVGTLAMLRGWPTQTFPDFFRGKLKAISEIFDAKNWEKYREDGTLSDFEELFSGRTRHRWLGDRLVDLTMWNMKISEFLNRVGDLQAYRQNILRQKVRGLQEQGLPIEEIRTRMGVLEAEAQKSAHELTNFIEFGYGPGFRSLMQMNPIGQLLFQYNTYALKHGQVLYQFFKDTKVQELLPDLYKAVREGHFPQFFKELATEERGNLLRYIVYGSAVVTAYSLMGGQTYEYFTKGAIPDPRTPGIQTISHIFSGQIDKLGKDLQGLVPGLAQAKRTIGSLEALKTGEITQRKGPLGLSQGRVQYRVSPGIKSAADFLFFGTGATEVAAQKKQIEETAKRSRDYRDLRDKLTDAFVEQDQEEFRKLFRQIFDEFGVVVDIDDVIKAAEGRRKTKLERIKGTLPLEAR